MSLDGHKPVEQDAEWGRIKNMNKNFYKDAVPKLLLEINKYLKQPRMIDDYRAFSYIDIIPKYLDIIQLMDENQALEEDSIEASFYQNALRFANYVYTNDVYTGFLS